VLHYSSSTRQLASGDLLLVDAGANFQGLATDVTRTYPVNGQFTPAQRTIYELVLRSQDAGMAAAALGAPATAIVRASMEAMADGLMDLGLITERSQVGTWFTHSPIHGIGLDVHDPFDTERPLGPGMAFVIEPGLYFRDDGLARIGRSGRREADDDPDSNAAIVDAVRPAFERYRGIGVRIEDSFLMTAAGLERLSTAVPRDVPAIERLVGTATDSTAGP
jgi:Xaa-Pro aminopeptidase